jgi:hypothetical protein
MDLNSPKRMRRPRAAARRMAQVSVDRVKLERVLGVDMWSLLKDARCNTKKNVCGGLEFLKERCGAGGTSYNNSVWA